MRAALFAALCCVVFALPAGAEEPIFLASNPALSPDGKLLAFGWAGDVWVAPITGGAARQLTRHPGRDGSPVFSPDGKEIAFVSDRAGSAQLFIMPADGGEPRQVTFHTAGFDLQDWFPDGKRLLALGSRDHYWGRGASRFLAIDAAQRKAEQTLFDDYGANGQLSPDGKKLLYTREGAGWTRKGYHGSQASQVWLFDLAEGTHKKLLHRETESRWPLWKPDGSGFYYVGGAGKVQQLFEHRFADGVERPLTQMTEDSVVYPCISRDGSTIVFRHRFDLYRLKPGNGAPEKIDLKCTLDRTAEKVNRRVLQTATNVAFNAEGTEIAFIAGGDVWVMDTELKEPRQVTATPEEERDVVFGPEGESLWFVSDAGGQCDIRKAVRKDATKPWFLNEQFPQTKVTDDAEVEAGLKFSPVGDRVAFVKGRGDLWTMDLDGKNAKKLLAGFTRPEFDWAPDGQWFVVSKDDNDFNRDVLILPVDGSRPPYNLSRHPFPDGNPVWSPNGKMIAFVGARGEPGEAAGARERDIFYVYLTQDEDEQGNRDRAIEKSLEKIRKAKLGLPITEPGATPAATAPGGDPAAPTGPRRRRPDGGAESALDDPKKEDDKKDEPKKDEAKKEPEKPKKQPPPKVVIDFDKLNERVRRIRLADSSESGLVWSPDSKKLAFNGAVEGKRGVCVVEFPELATPKFLSATTLGDARWIKTSNLLVGHAAGVPSTLATAAGASPTGATPTAYRFSAQQTEDLPAKRRAVFDLAWRTMRDSFYDDQLGKNDWNAIRAKYADMAQQAPDDATLAVVCNMMLGELNGSHLGFSITGGLPRGQAPADPQAGAKWSESTAHLGVRFDPMHAGPGLLIRDVLAGGPADQKKSKLGAGEVILAIDGQAVEPSQDLTAILNGKLPRDVKLKVKAKDGKERELTLRAFSYAEVRPLLYRKWIEDNRAAVEKLSGGKLGYLHIDAMSMPSFYKFEEELYAQGHGKDGLVIDVRENGGGSTADHLLTALTQPVHAYAVPRGGDQIGYPQDRKVYATWNKPIIVLCNQNSFSNAEIFSHAVKTLKRGQVVGVPTAGGVISTGGTAIMDVGFLRQPFRGWYLVGDGEDMELNGCVPNIVLWPEPGQMPKGEDKQLEKAVEALQADVKAWQARPQPQLRKASSRPDFDK